MLAVSAVATTRLAPIATALPTAAHKSTHVVSAEVTVLRALIASGFLTATTRLMLAVSACFPITLRATSLARTALVLLTVTLSYVINECSECVFPLPFFTYFSVCVCVFTLFD